MGCFTLLTAALNEQFVRKFYFVAFFHVDRGEDAVVKHDRVESVFGGGGGWCGRGFRSATLDPSGDDGFRFRVREDEAVGCFRFRSWYRDDVLLSAPGFGSRCRFARFNEFGGVVEFGRSRGSVGGEGRAFGLGCREESPLGDLRSDPLGLLRACP